MDEIEICCISSESDSADEKSTTSKTTIKNITTTQTTPKKNIYDINELEGDDISTENDNINAGNCDDYLKELIQKYSSSSSNTNANYVGSYDNSFNFTSCSSSTGELERCNVDVGYYYSSQTESSPKSRQSYELLSSSDEDDNGQNSIDRKRKKQSNGYRNKSPLREVNKITEKISKKEQLEIERTNKRNEKMRKKEQLLEQKALKQAQKIVDNSCKEAYCLQYVTINMDNSICDDPRFGQYLREFFDEKKITYKVNTLLPGLLSWTRKILSIENEKVKETETDEQHYAVVIKSEAFGNLLSCIQSIQEQVNFKHLTIIIYGQVKPTPAQENEMTSITIQFHTYWQFITNKENLGNVLFMLTKSIAQKPYKSNQEMQYTEEYYEDCNRKKIKVDKDGSGMGQLWRQMLTMFPLVRLETAEAITTAYPTLSSLFAAYENCTESPEELIQDLSIRRAHGPTVANKKVGIKLSTKCFRYFTLKDDDLV